MKNIFIGNLDSETTPETIRGLFAPLGTVRRLRLMTHPATGLSRGFAFVWMREVEAGPAIAALDGRVVDGNAISVRLGRPQLRHSKRTPQLDRSITPDARAGERRM
jgi:RNA recognition motif-containing protein